MADQLEQVRRHARGFLDDGEELVAAMTASPRGRNTATAAGGVGSMDRIQDGLAPGRQGRAGQLECRVSRAREFVESFKRVAATDPARAFSA